MSGDGEFNLNAHFSDAFVVADETPTGGADQQQNTAAESPTPPVAATGGVATLRAAQREFKQVVESIVDSACTRLSEEVNRLQETTINNIGGYSEEIKNDFLKTVTKPENLKIDAFVKEYVTQLVIRLDNHANSVFDGAAIQIEKQINELRKTIEEAKSIANQDKFDLIRLRDYVAVGFFSSVLTAAILVFIKKYI